MELRQGFEATGKYTPTQALLRAVKFVLPENTVKEAETPREEPKPKTDAKNLRNKVDAANKQPPDTDSVGEQGNSMGKNAEDPNPLDMSEEDWDALPESTLKRMRGDLY